MRRALILLLLVATTALVACGGSASDEKSAKQTLASVKPLKSAQTAVALRVFFDNAPASVGDKLELTMNGPLRNNGADKLPSLDWKIAFSGLATKFTSRVVSTGDNFFINLGGQDFEAGEQAVQQLTDQAQESKQKGLAQVGLNPLAAVRNVKAAGDRTFDGETLKVYKGDDRRRRRARPDRAAEPGPPQRRRGADDPRRQAHGRAARAGQAHVRKPRFEAAVADDDTIRQLLVTSTFTTPAANREAAGGITGGHMEYRVDYTKVGEDDHDHAAEEPAAALRLRAAGPADPVQARLVTHSGQVEPVRRRRAPRLRARAPLEQPRERLQAAAPLGHLEHRPHQDAVHVAHERVGLDVELEHVAGALPAGAEHVALEALVVGVGGREGGEVVRPGAAAPRRRAAPPRPADAATTARGRARTATAPPRASSR